MEIKISPSSLSKKFVMTVDMTDKELRGLQEVLFLIHYIIPAGSKIPRDQYALLRSLWKELYYHNVNFTSGKSEKLDRRDCFGLDSI
jgi:hypothetical protein